MGVLSDLGIVSGGKLTKNAFNGFISDVRRRLRTGQGIFKFPDLSSITQPISLYELAQIENPNLFPEFHSIWRERYEKMVKQLDVPGSFQLVKGGIPLIDPVALAKAMGMQELPEVKFPDIFFEIQGLPPPDGIPAPPPTIQDVMSDPTGVKSLDFFYRYMRDLDPLDPAIPAKLVSIVTAAPVPPVPQFPNPKTNNLGYTQRYAFENTVYNCHRATHASMLSQAPLLLPNTIIELATGQGCYSLMKATKETAKLTQPRPMSTSALEIAAQEIYLQHQVKLQCAALLGQTLGSGAILTALASTPEDVGGLGLINTSSTQQTETSSAQGTSAGSTSGETSTTASAGTSGGTPSATTGGGTQTSQDSYGTAGDVTQTQEGQSTQGDGSTTTQPDGYGFGAPPEEGAYEDQDGTQTPTGQGFGAPPEEGTYEDGSYTQQQDSTTPSGYGFGSPPEEGDAPIESQPSGAEAQPEAYPGQPQDFGFGPPPQETNVDSTPSDEPTTGGFGSPPEEGPPQADVYPPEGSGQGQQAYPPGFGDYPPDVGQEPWQPPNLSQPSEENTGRYIESGKPEPYDPEQDDTPADIKYQDYDKLYIPPPGQGSYSSPEDEDENEATPSGASKSSTKNLSKVRKRIKDLIEGGETCPAEGGFIGGILGKPTFDFASAGFGANNTFRGINNNSISKEWEKPIPGTRPDFIIGSGYTDLATVKSEGNKPNPATSCTQMPGYIFNNVFFTPGGPKDNTRISINSESNATARSNGWPYDMGDANSASVIGPGLGGPCYAAAFVGAWVSVDPSPLGNGTPPGDPIKSKPPKYGDIYIIRDGNKSLRHIGVFIEWNPDEGYAVTADAGQGSLKGGSQGMAYMKRNLKLDPVRGYVMSGEASQNDQNALRVLCGWIDMDVYVKKVTEQFDLYLNSSRPSWV